MEERRLRTEELTGLAIAAILHAALAGVLLLQPNPEKKDIVKPQERITVSLASEVGLTATSPDPAEVSRASQAPVLSPDPSPGETVLDTPDTQPDPTPPEDAAVPAPPTPRDTATRRRPERQKSKPPKEPSPKKPPPKKPSPKKPPPKKPAAKPSGGASKVGSDFLAGAGTSNTGSAKSAAPFGRSERAALNRAITRALRPHWKAPTGLDADQLVTPVTWRLNKDGSLSGTPRCKSAKGVTASNRPQVKRHCDAAMRAVRLAAPFRLPEQFYSRWDDLEWEFDRKL